MQNSIQENISIWGKIKLNKKEIQVHTAVWLAYSICIFIWYSFKWNILGLLDLALTACLWIGTFYSYHLYIFPKILKARKWVTFVFLFLLLHTVYLTLFIGEEKLLAYLGYEQISIDIILIIKRGSFWYVNFVLIALGYHFYGESIKQKQQKLIVESNLQKVEIELKNSELENLKAQFNPHFLFNSLWYIYTLVQGENQKATKAVELLSDMMRYSMQNHEVGELVPLENELNYVNNYIELQRLRNPFMKLDFQLEGDIDGVNILPLVLISFVENAFKHGKIDEIENPLTVHLKVAKDQFIDFSINNKISLLGKERSSGIGLENVKRRLKSTYGDKHTLNIEKDSQFYRTSLNIKLS